MWYLMKVSDANTKIKNCEAEGIKYDQTKVSGMCCLQRSSVAELK
jgi:hypothetical protein